MAAIYNRSRMRRFVLQTILAFLAFLWLIPILWMVLTSVKPESEILSLPFRVLPTSVTVEHYVTALQRSSLLLWFMNSVIVTVAQVTLAVTISALAAYAFARISFRGRNVLFLIVLSTLMVPSQVTLIPTYLIVSRLSWVNTYQAVFVPELGAAFGIFLLRQFFSGIPKELEESAQIDGASRLRMFLQIIIPMSVPALSALSIFTSLTAWNNFLWPLIVLNRSEMLTLPVGLAMLQGTYGTESFGVLMAAAVIASAPILIIYMVFQRKIIQGVSITGVIK